MSEPTNPKVPLAAGIQPVTKPAGTAAVVVPGPPPAAPVVQSVPAPAKPPALFGGHRGGGKKRQDGLVAGSPEAIAADKESDRKRKQESRAANKVAALPSPLPGAKNPMGETSVAVPVDSGVVPGAAPGAFTGAPVGVAATFVAWSNTMLGRPVKLLTKIVERVRCAKLMEKIRGLGFDKETEIEVEKKIAYKQNQLEDFNAALTNCAVIELNKRTVPGAQHSHWLELAMAGGELLNCHLDTVDFLEKKLLERQEKKKADTVEISVKI